MDNEFASSLVPCSAQLSGLRLPSLDGSVQEHSIADLENLQSSDQKKDLPAQNFQLKSDVAQAR